MVTDVSVDNECIDYDAVGYLNSDDEAQSISTLSPTVNYQSKVRLQYHITLASHLFSLIFISDQMNQHNCCTKLRPARTAHDVEFLRSANEVGRLHLANQTQLPPKQGVPRPVQQNPVPPVDEAQLSLRPHTLENERNDVTESLQKLSVGAQEVSFTFCISMSVRLMMFLGVDLQQVGNENEHSEPTKNL